MSFATHYMRGEKERSTILLRSWLAGRKQQRLSLAAVLIRAEVPLSPDVRDTRDAIL